MPEYIDREDYCKNLCHCHNEYCDKESCPIWKAPAADVAPVAHGEWIVCGDGADVPFMCSHCGKTVAASHKRMYDNYCPNCGAKMDLEVTDNG